MSADRLALNEPAESDEQRLRSTQDATGVRPAATVASSTSAAPEPRPQPSITVVVPVRNEAAFLGRTLEQLVGQDYDPDRFEILVVDGQSTDATKSIAESFAARHPNLTVHDNPRRLSSAARNVGVRHARGDLIVVVDGHCELDGNGYLHDIAEAFARSNADCLGRPQPLDVAEATTLQRAVAAARSNWLGHHPASFIYSGREQFAPAHSVAVAYRREVFERVGLFDERFDACEDVELNHRVDRAGLRCLFTPAITARYAPRSSLRGLFRQMDRYGRGRVRLLRKHPETISLGTIAPAAWLCGLILGPSVALVWTPLGFIYLATIGLYLALVVLATLQVAWRHREWRFLPLAPAVYVTIHSGTGYGILCEIFRGYYADQLPLDSNR